jgi:hypothetical protein
MDCKVSLPKSHFFTTLRFDEIFIFKVWTFVYHIKKIVKMLWVEFFVRLFFRELKPLGVTTAL